MLQNYGDHGRPNVAIFNSSYLYSIGHLTVACLVTRPMTASEAGGDPALIQTSLLFSFKCKLVSIRTTWFTQQKQWRLYQNKVTSSLAAIQRPGHWTDNCKLIYSLFHAQLFVQYLPFIQDWIRQLAVNTDNSYQLIQMYRAFSTTKFKNLGRSDSTSESPTSAAMLKSG